MSEPGSNLARVLGVWAEIARGQSMSPLADLLTDDVVWQGLLPELACHGREEVSELLGSARGGGLPRVTRMEAEEVGDRVVVTVDGPDFGPGPPGTALEHGGPRTLVLTFRDGRVVRMESVAARHGALAKPT